MRSDVGMNAYMVGGVHIIGGEYSVCDVRFVTNACVVTLEEPQSLALW